MTRSLVICLMLAVTTALVAAVAALVAGWGLIAALGLYCAFGSTSLVVAAIAVTTVRVRSRPILPVETEGAETPAYA